MKKPRIKHLSVLLFIILINLLSGASIYGGEAVTSLAQLNEPGRKIGVEEATPEESVTREMFNKAGIWTYSDPVAAYREVANGKLDAYIHARTETALAIENGVSGVRLLDENVCSDIIAVGLSRVSSVPDLKKKCDAFIQELRDDGTLDDMYERWVTNGDETMPEIPKAENPVGTLRVGTTGNVMPYSYYVGTELMGYDIELARRFASRLNMDLSFSVYDFSGIFSAVQTGDIDCAMSNLYYTDEHAEAIDFSEPLFEVEIAALVKADDSASAAGTFWNSVKSGFEKTFIRESRWKLLLGGVLITLLISVLSILCGSALGFVIYIFCKRGNRIANAVTRVSVHLVQGTPVIVFLMILYYIIFGKVPVSRVLVAVVGFSFIFGISVYQLLKTGVETIDPGQAEAAYALGYSERRTFYRIILPQTLPFILPAYTGQVSALIKTTSVVGYIAVQDLTKVGDIIRGRTYEAFFPLITVAILYFLLTAVLTSAVQAVGRRFDTRHRRYGALLKGVKLHD